MSDLLTRLALRAISGSDLAMFPAAEVDLGPLKAETEEVDAAPKPGPAIEQNTTILPPSATELRPEKGSTPGPGPIAEASEGPMPALIPMPVVVPPAAPVIPDVRPTPATSPTDTVVAPIPMSSARQLIPEREPITRQPREAVSILRAAAPLPDEPPRRTSEVSATPSTVEVTIDRVEVRVRPPASAQAHPASREPARPTALSLEEYLRLREAGA